MSEKVLLKGNDAIAEAAIRAGCGAYFGYPITPQNELIAYMAREMLKRGRLFIQAESEVAAINMVYGASAAGLRSMTSSSSPGISLKQEGLSFAAGADVPLVVVNVVRGGPGLGSIAPAQSDYFQSTRGGGHGDYRCLVFAPKNVQECADLTYLAFDLSDQYRVTSIVLADGMIGQMMEGVVLPPEKAQVPKRGWVVGNMAERESRHISSIGLVPEKLEARTKVRFARYEEIESKEVRYEYIGRKDSELTIVAYGTSARVALGAIKLAEERGRSISLLRPITLWPFPTKAISNIAENGRPVITLEMSMGQLVEDVRLAVLGKAPVHLINHCGGVIPTEEEVFDKAMSILG